MIENKEAYEDSLQTSLVILDMVTAWRKNLEKCQTDPEVSRTNAMYTKKIADWIRLHC